MSHRPHRLSAITLAVHLAWLPAAASPAAQTPPDEGATAGPRILLAQKEGEPTSLDALFGKDADEEPVKPEAALNAPKPAARGGWKGFVQAEFARTVTEPVHWTKQRIRVELSRSGSLGERVKYRIGARADADGVYGGFDYSERYPSDVRRDQRFDATLRENYLDINLGSLDLRLGRQHVIWGEMVGLYFADVVSARDLTEFILPDFEAQRIPQWAARAEYFLGDLHAELLWIPVPSFDRIGKPGGEFYPFQPAPPGVTSLYRAEIRPERDASNTNYGARISGLVGGWDLSAFWYRSIDVSPTFSREIVSPTTFAFQARHDRIAQVGGALTKDFGAVVLKGEAVRTKGRKFAVLRAADADGLAASDTVDWAVGLDFVPLDDVRFNVQGFQRIFRQHDPDMIGKEKESGYSLYLTGKFSDRFEAQVLYIASLDREDWLARPKLIWNLERNWRAQVGVDVFRGPPLGLFGQYEAKDRGYLELRHSF